MEKETQPFASPLPFVTGETYDHLSAYLLLSFFSAACNNHYPEIITATSKLAKVAADFDKGCQTFDNSPSTFDKGWLKLNKVLRDLNKVPPKKNKVS